MKVIFQQRRRLIQDKVPHKITYTAKPHRFLCEYCPNLLQRLAFLSKLVTRLFHFTQRTYTNNITSRFSMLPFYSDECIGLYIAILLNSQWNHHWRFLYFVLETWASRCNFANVRLNINFGRVGCYIRASFCWRSMLDQTRSVIVQIYPPKHAFDWDLQQIMIHKHATEIRLL